MLTDLERQWREKRLEMINEYESHEKRVDFIDDDLIWGLIKKNENPDIVKVREILSKAKELKGLSPEDVATLANCKERELVDELFQTAYRIKNEVYGKRIVLFAPIYVSNPCVNNCVYCGYRHSNPEINRQTLTMEALKDEVKTMTRVGHKRTVAVFGEHPSSDADYIAESVRTIYETKDGRNEIRRVNVNAAPMAVDEYQIIRDVGIGTYQVFQETYHHETYRRLHPKDTIKNSFKWRLFSLHRAQEAGIDDVAIGVLFGLYDWRFEILGLLYHAMDMEKEFGVGPHTISFPRLKPAINTPFSTLSPYLVSDEDFKKVVAILRCAVPYTGLILTAREPAGLRKELIMLGVSQTDAGTRIAVGGYQQMAKEHIPEREQFIIDDTRSLDDFLCELSLDGFIPSLCTACYRSGRTGEHFMGLPKSAAIKYFCTPNAILTFKEYLIDYASEKTKEVGQRVIEEYLKGLYQERPMLADKVKGYIKMMEEEKERDFYV